MNAFQIKRFILPTLWDKAKLTLLKAEAEALAQAEQEKNINAANYVQPFMKQGQVFTIDFELLNSLIVDDNTQYYFRQWDVQIFEGVDAAEVEYMLDLISSNLVYNIIYQEGTDNLFDFYNIGDDLRQVAFFSSEGNILYFHVSVFIKKTFGAPPITIPSAKLEILIKPFLTIKI